MYYLLLLLAVVAGVVIPMQAALNAELGRAVKSPELGALLSFVVGIIGLFLYCLLVRVDMSQWKNALQIEWYYWLGGLMGAFFVLSLIILAPRLGTALTLGITVAGQMIFALIMDHYGWMGLTEQPFSWYKFVGVAMIIGGVFLLRA